MRAEGDPRTIPFPISPHVILPLKYICMIVFEAIGT